MWETKVIDGTTFTKIGETRDDVTAEHVLGELRAQFPGVILVRYGPENEKPYVLYTERPECPMCGCPTIPGHACWYDPPEDDADSL